MSEPGGIFSCCPCGIFTVRSQSSELQPAEKYKVTVDDDFYRRKDDDDDKYIIPLEPDDVVASQTDVTLKSEPTQEPEAHQDDEIFTTNFQGVADSDGEIDAWQLNNILNQCFRDVQFDGFSVDVCRSMVALSDNNLSGKINYREARILFDQLQKWKDSYKTFDSDRSGYFHGQELQTLLQSLGYEVDSKTVHAMTRRYSDKEGRIYFVDLVSCLLKFTSMYEAYQYKMNNNDQSFSTDEFIQLTMYS